MFMCISVCVVHARVYIDVRVYMHVRVHMQGRVHLRVCGYVHMHVPVRVDVHERV